ncbi:hypothetical protein Tco_0473485, partial [Tanacetum coccineum]
GEANTTSTPTSPTSQAQVTYVSESVLSSKFDAKTFITWKEELTLEQTQQGVSYEVSVSIEGVEE